MCETYCEITHIMRLYRQHNTLHNVCLHRFVCLNMCYEVRHGVWSGQILRHYPRICPGSADKTQKMKFSIADGPFSFRSKHIMKNPHPLFPVILHVFLPLLSL
jgi:hypothetical protein